MASRTDYRKFFRFHGVALSTGTQLIGECPFCLESNSQGQGRFMVNAKTGQWDCKICSASGNAYTFLQAIYDLYYEATTANNYKVLSKSRSLPVKVFEEEGLAWDGSRWLLPVYNGDSSMVNLHTWVEEGKPVISSPAPCTLHLFGENLEWDNPLYLVEGPWDAYALRYLLSRNKEGGTVVAAPGAGTFKKEWLEWFRDYDVRIIYDNDLPGSNGATKVSGLLSSIASKLSVIQWPDRTPDGYDVRDLVVQHKNSKGKALVLLHRMLAETKTESVKTGIRTRKGRPPALSTLIREFKKRLYVDKTMEDSLVIMLAVVASILSPEIDPSDPLWMFLIGPPGAGKTLFIQAIGEAAACHYVSAFRATTLVSGFKMPDGSDPSLLPLLVGKCLTIRDMTDMFSMSKPEQDAVFGLMCQVYDGDYIRPWGHQEAKSYPDCWFSLVAGVTSIARSRHAGWELGQRFLYKEFINEKDHNQDDHVDGAMRAMNQGVENKRALGSICADFLDRDYGKTGIPAIPPWYMDRVRALSQLVVLLRSGATEKSGTLYRPSIEIATRVAKQTLKLSQALTIVLNKSKIDMEVYLYARQVALDSAIPWHLAIVTLLVHLCPRPVPLQEIHDKTRISLTSVQRRMEILFELNVVSRIGRPPIGPGQPGYLYFPTPRILQLWKDAKL